jgi:hypothetical protein
MKAWRAHRLRRVATEIWFWDHLRGFAVIILEQSVKALPTLDGPYVKEGAEGISGIYDMLQAKVSDLHDALTGKDSGETTMEAGVHSLTSKIFDAVRGSIGGDQWKCAYFLKELDSRNCESKSTMEPLMRNMIRRRSLSVSNG